MGQLGHPRPALVAFLVAAALTAGCGPASQTVSGAATSTPGAGTAAAGTSGSAGPAPTSTIPGSQVQPAPSAAGGGHGGRGGGAAGSPAAVGLPADWPPDLPVPQGQIMGSTGTAGRWTVLILVPGSATQVRQSTAAFYSAAGFTAVTDSVLNRGNRQITLVTENRDHSATQTNLMIGVTTR
jgi:hypothetical protein